MSPEEAKELRPLNTAALKVLTEDDSEDAIVYINELLKTSDTPSNNQNFWFPTPDNPGDPKTHTPIQSRILREIKELEEIQKLNPTNSDDEREAFLINLKWDDTQLSADDQKRHRRNTHRVQRHFRQAQTGYWNQPRYQNQTHAED